MSSDQEDRKEKLARLLAKNKTRLARDKLIERYQQELGYPLAAEQFIDLEVSHRIKREVYQKAAKLKHQETFDFQDILTALERLKEQSSQLGNTKVIFYYLDTRETGGIDILFKDFWMLLKKIGDEPRTDIIVVEEHFAFGICVELEEYSYLLTSWGFKGEDQ
jgi:hypothetical protein